MSKLATHATLAEDAAFRQVLRAAMVQKAIVDASTPKLPSMTAEEVDCWLEARTFAVAVMNGAEGFVGRFAWGVAGNAGVLEDYASHSGDLAQVDDAVIEAAVGLVWALQIESARADG